MTLTDVQLLLISFWEKNETGMTNKALFHTVLNHMIINVIVSQFSRCHVEQYL